MLQKSPKINNQKKTKKPKTKKMNQNLSKIMSKSKMINIPQKSLKSSQKITINIFLV